VALRTLLERLATQQEGWIMPSLTKGFAGERETGGMHLLGTVEQPGAVSNLRGAES
jgi:hypothetical protein